ncbi:MAG: fumarylacetoacetate hydrolase family protein [Actinomycetota bacterium]|nr:fumarylacetoacetate hydrolase family protein [Actinomycetota bacterium]
MSPAPDVGALAKHLHEANRARTLVARLTDDHPELSLEQGFEIQLALRERHLAEGARLVGAKLGLTSRAKQAQMGLSAPVHGFLTDAMRLETGEPLVVAALGQPRVEPEIAFVIRRDLAGPAVTSTEVLAATAAVCPALEILDSRYPDYKFTLPDVVADNTSAGRFVLGATLTPPLGIDLRLVGCVFERNGALAGTAAGAASLGHPAAAVAALVRELAARGEGLSAGDVVMSGGLTEAVPVVGGDVVAARFDRLGAVELACV